MHHGGALPIRAAILLAAEKWSTPPWVIVDEPKALMWFWYWNFFEDQRAKAKK